MATSPWTDWAASFVSLFPLQSAWDQHWLVMSIGKLWLTFSRHVCGICACRYIPRKWPQMHNIHCATFLFHVLSSRMSLCWFFVHMHACRPVGVRNHLDSVVCSGFEESIFDCQHMLGGDNCSSSVGIECSKAIGYVVTIILLCVYVCVCVCVCTVEPLYNDTSEMRTSPLIRTPCMAPATYM